jgi:hypothetical protein
MRSGWQSHQLCNRVELNVSLATTTVPFSPATMSLVDHVVFRAMLSTMILAIFHLGVPTMCLPSTTPHCYEHQHNHAQADRAKNPAHDHLSLCTVGAVGRGTIVL